jgi:hypothetical protein
MLDPADLAGVSQLLELIQSIHSRHGDDNCWMDVDLIFKQVGLPSPDRSVGCKEAMLGNCRRYLEVLCSGGKWKSYAELESENNALREQILLQFKLISELNAPSR